MHISTLTSTQEKNTDILKWFDLLFFILMKRFVERRLFPQCWTSASLDFSVRVWECVWGGYMLFTQGCLFSFCCLQTVWTQKWTEVSEQHSIFWFQRLKQTPVAANLKQKNFKFFTLLSNVTSVSTHCLNSFFHLMRHKNATKSCFLKRQLSNKLKPLLLLNVLSFIPVSVQVKNVLISK